MSDPRYAVLVDSDDKVLGTMELVAAHRQPGFLHRAISVFLFRRNQQTQEIELLIQQRSAVKFTCAGEWANTCCGNVRPGESYEECAHRRLREELGIEGVHLTAIDKFEYTAACNDDFIEHEIDTVFVGWYDGAVQPVPSEVQEYEWIPLAVFAEGLQPPATRQYVPWESILVFERQILKKAQAALQF